MTTKLLTRRPSFYHYFLSLLAVANIALSGTTVIADTFGCVVMLYLITRRETRARWWGLMTVGLFAAALHAFGAVAPQDTRATFLLLAGCYLIGYGETRLSNTFGTLYLVAAASIKEPALLFLAGGLGYLVGRDLRTGASARRCWPSAIVALTAIALLSAPQRLVLDVTPAQIATLAEWIARYFTVPAALAGAGLQLSLERGRPLSIWAFLLPLAFVSALLTPTVDLNGFLPFAVWLILTAVLALPRLMRAVPWLDHVHFPAVSLTVAMVAPLLKLLAGQTRL